MVLPLVIVTRSVIRVNNIAVDNPPISARIKLLSIQKSPNVVDCHFVYYDGDVMGEGRQVGDEWFTYHLSGEKFGHHRGKWFQL